MIRTSLMLAAVLGFVAPAPAIDPTVFYTYDGWLHNATNGARIRPLDATNPDKSKGYHGLMPAAVHPDGNAVYVVSGPGYWPVLARVGWNGQGYTGVYAVPAYDDPAYWDGLTVTASKSVVVVTTNKRGIRIEFDPVTLARKPYGGGNPPGRGELQTGPDPGLPTGVSAAAYDPGGVIRPFQFGAPATHDLYFDFRNGATQAQAEQCVKSTVSILNRWFGANGFLGRTDRPTNRLPGQYATVRVMPTGFAGRPGVAGVTPTPGIFDGALVLGFTGKDKFNVTGSLGWNPYVDRAVLVDGTIGWETLPYAIAHECGHGLWLDHVAETPANNRNLMMPSMPYGRDELNPAQVTTGNATLNRWPPGQSQAK